MPRKIKLAFAGVGGMGQAAHLRNYATLHDDCEVVALAELRPRLAQDVARKYNIPRTYPTIAAMLAQEHVDGIVASQPFSRHGVLVPEIAQARVPIFTEKPLAASVAVGERIVESVAAAGTWHMVGYHKRSDPASEFAKKTIDELKRTGELGRLTYVRIAMPPGDWVAAGWTDNIESTDVLSPLANDPPPADMDDVTAKEYEAFVNYYIHQVNLLRFLVGEPYRVTYADPARVLLVGHSASGIPCTLEMAAYQTTLDWHETALVAFERGFVRLSLPAPLAFNRPGHVEIFKDPGHGATPVSLQPTLPWVHAMRNQALNFIKAIRGEQPAPCLAPEALEDIRLARDYIRLLKGV
ncbi:Gfo/Idh/MocA family oxidoreductase [Horticoccus luteus]|uniref:Gfo/Idh/MocA family oxidoreductase n=1 Tax=Horticoccus luteus TaxID=2862869 RepID=A0A8F9TU86_9BACT|nr:Gfo/Idh/MocA family oxidoreductase [Horticoccus luteus]QYM78388.1 Gfo/Idh/MocA family oxidoreductase [Horticoccus luteus]